MKRLIFLLISARSIRLFNEQLTGCKRTPPPPTEQDAIAVWKNTHADRHIAGSLSLKKTNGQMRKSERVEVYTLYYQAKVKDVVQLGNTASRNRSKTIKATSRFNGRKKGGWDRTTKSIQFIEKPLASLTPV